MNYGCLALVDHYKSLIECTDKILMRYKNEVDHILRYADELVEKKFIFKSKWDMERTYEYYQFENEIDWNVIPFGDPEWTYQLNRHNFWIDLLKSYVFTKEEKYYDAFLVQFNSWHTSSVNRSKKMYRTLECSIRLINWVKIISLLQALDKYTDDIKIKFNEMIIDHIEAIKTGNSDKKFKSNWGVIESFALLWTGLFIHDNELIEYAKTNLRKQLEFQFISDGTHIEQSPMYQNIMLIYLMDTYQLFKMTDRDELESFKEYIDLIGRSSISMMGTSRKQLVKGDSDKTCVDDILIKLVLILKHEGMNSLVREVPFEVIWDCGIDTKDKLDKINKSVLPLDNFLVESGNLVSRSGWNDNDTTIYMYGSNMYSDHNHYDMLHLGIVRNNEDILVDSGRFTYVGSDIRRQLISSAAHNTITVNDVSYKDVSYNSNDKFFIKSAIANYGRTCEESAFLSTTTSGYMKMGIVIQRSVMYLKDDLLIMVDETISNKKNKVTQHFNFNPCAEIEKTDQFIKYKSKKVIAEFIFSSKNTLELKNTLFSEGYNKIQENKKVEVCTNVKGCTPIMTFISLNNADDFVEATVEELELDIMFSVKYRSFGQKVRDRINRKIKVFEGQTQSSCKGYKFTKGSREYVVIYNPLERGIVKYKGHFFSEKYVVIQIKEEEIIKLISVH